jgi:hypothetical protein
MVTRVLKRGIHPHGQLTSRAMKLRRLCIHILLLLSFGAAGCGETEPEALRLVRGRIFLDGKPLPRGAVSLHPDGDRDSWEQPTGSVDSEGQYSLYTQGREGVAPGKYRVVVFATESVMDDASQPHPNLPRSLVPQCYNSSGTTPLRLDVAEEPPSQNFDLELSSNAK